MTDIAGKRTLPSQWNETVKFYGDQTFLEYISINDEHVTYSYSNFHKRVIQIANWFHSLGIKKGELVALHLHNSPEYLMCWLALSQIGAVSVPLNEHYCLQESEFVLKKCDIHRIIVEPSSLFMYQSNRKELQLTTIILAWGECPSKDILPLSASNSFTDNELEVSYEALPEETAVILFTSGTTKHPKGVIYTHCNVVYGGILHMQQIGMCPGDRFLSCMPCYHMDFQEMAAMSVIVAGGTLIMVEHYSARRFWKQICDTKANFADTMSIMNRTLMLQPVQPLEKDHCLKQVYFSMGLSTEEKDEFERRFGVSLLNSYGMTETISAVTCSPISGDKNWPSVGRAALSYDVKIIDCDGNEVSDGTIGEICIHGVPGRSLTPGYYNDAEATECLLDKEGWLHSGDRGYLDENGWLFFIDRWGNMIKRSGENISSLEVECVLTSNPKIADAAVIGVPDPIRNQAVKAFIQLADNETMTISEVESYCSKRLCKFKVPTIWEFVSDFPRTATGKIKKKELK